MADLTPCSSLEHVQAFHKKEINSLTSPLKTASLYNNKKINIVKEFCVRKTNFTCNAASTTAIDEKRQKFNPWKTKRHIKPVASSPDSVVGSLVQDGLVYRENILVRSFEIGFDGKMSLATMSSYLQDTALNHSNIIGVLADGLGLTPEMSRKDLIWVISTMRIIMEHYPSWLDVIQVDTWMYQSGNNGLGRDWIVSDARTGKPVAYATSISFLMNNKTRKLSKFSKEINAELGPYMMDECNPIIEKNGRKMLKFDVNTADYSSTGLTPGWNDLDLNQHVNHVKYINWILQNIPRSLVEDHKLCAINLEYKKECNTDSKLNSLSKIVTNDIDLNNNNNKHKLVMDHLLLLHNGHEILRGSTMWKARDST